MTDLIKLINKKYSLDNKTELVFYGLNSVRFAVESQTFLTSNFAIIAYISQDTKLSIELNPFISSQTIYISPSLKFHNQYCHTFQIQGDFCQLMANILNHRKKSIFQNISGPIMVFMYANL